MYIHTKKNNSVDLRYLIVARASTFKRFFSGITPFAVGSFGFAAISFRLLCRTFNSCSYFRCSTSGANGTTASSFSYSLKEFGNYSETANKVLF